MMERRAALLGMLMLPAGGRSARTAGPAAQGGDRWRPIFNGRDLAGWGEYLELYCLGQNSVHLVNGTPNMVLTGLRRRVEGRELPLTEGRTQFQSEGAEVFYRNVAIRSVREMPGR